MNYRLFLFLLLLPLSFTAQIKKVKAKIINSGALYSTYNFDADVGALKEAVKFSGGAKLLPDIINYSHEDNWPEWIKTFDAREEHRPAINDYTVYKIISTSKYCILLVPASENKHMDIQMRPTRDIYFIMGLTGVEFEGNNPAPPPIEEEAEEEITDYEDDIRAYIVDPGQLYSTFDLANDENAKDVLLYSEILTEEEFAVLAEMVKEDSWPSGMSTLDARLSVRDKIMEYEAYYAASFGPEGGDEYTLVWIPLYGNEHMPENMQPLTDIGMYMIFRSDAINLEY